MKKTILVLLALLLALTMTVLLVACNDNPGPVDPTDQDPCKNGHVEDDGEVTVQPTCQTEGTRTYRCKVCGEVVKTETVDKTDHVWDNGTQTKDPGCGTVGKMTFHCTVEGCNETKTEDIPATGVHTKGTWVPEEPATCKKEGTHSYYQCTNCSAKLDDDGNEYDADDLVIPKAAHTWDNGVVTPATCEEEGHITYTCEVCSTTSTQTIPANGHTYGELIPQQDATCEHTGVEAHYMCSVCGKLFDQAKEQVEETDLEIGLAKHTLDEVTGTPATCTEDGFETYYKCNVCNKLFADDKAETPIEQPKTLTATGHKPIPYGDKAATCTEAGYANGKICSECGTVIVQPKRVAPLGHDYKLQGWKWGSSNLTATATFTCSHENCPEPTVQVTGDATVESTLDTDTFTVQVKGPDGRDYTQTTTYDHNHPHVYEFVEWLWAGDDESGYTATAVFDCSKCHKVPQEVPGDVATQVQTAVSCTTDGVTVYTATASYNGVEATPESKTVTAPALGHKIDPDKFHKGTEVTCLEDGTKDYYECANGCDSKLDADGNVIDDLTIKAVGHHTYNGYETNATQHWQECTVCGQSTAKTNHTKDYSPIDGTSKHHESCDICGYEADVNCSSLSGDFSGKCRYCGVYHGDEIKIHFHVGEGWGSTLYVYAWSGSDLITGDWPGMNGGDKNAAQKNLNALPETWVFEGEGWYVITLHVRSGLLGNTLEVIINDNAQPTATQTGNIKVNDKEIFIPGLAKGGEYYHDREGAINAEKGPKHDYTFYFYAPEWPTGEGVNIYTYGPELWPNWPGTSMKSVAGKANWYSAVYNDRTIPTALSIMFFAPDESPKYEFKDITLPSGVTEFYFHEGSGVAYQSEQEAIEGFNAMVKDRDPIRVHFGNNVVTIYLVSPSGDVKTADFGKYTLYTFNTDAIGFGGWEEQHYLATDMYATGTTTVPTGWIFRWDSKKSQTADIKNVFKAGKYYKVVLPQDSGKNASVVEVEGHTHTHAYVLDTAKGTNGWTWTDYTAATAHFKCTASGCTEPSKDVTATITHKVVEGVLRYTATAATPVSGVEVTSTKDYEPQTYWFTGILSGKDSTWGDGEPNECFTWDVETQRYSLTITLKAGDIFLIKLNGTENKLGYAQLGNVSWANELDETDLIALDDVNNVTVLLDCTLTISFGMEYETFDVVVEAYTPAYIVKELLLVGKINGANAVWGDNSTYNFTWNEEAYILADVELKQGDYVLIKQKGSDDNRLGYTSIKLGDDVVGKVFAKGEETYGGSGLFNINVLLDSTVTITINKDYTEINITVSTYHEHNYGQEIPAVPGNCTEAGVKAHYHCEVCNRDFVLQDGVYVVQTAEQLSTGTVPDAHDFVYDKLDEDGYHTVRCSRNCDYSAQKEACTPDNNGNWHKDADYHWYVCEKCKEEYSHTQHNFQLQGGKCSACGEEQSDVTIQADGVDDHRVGSIAEAITYIHQNHNTIYAGKTEVTIVLNSNRQSTGFTLSDDREVTGFHLVIDLNNHSFTVTETSINVVAGANVTFKNGIFQGGSGLGDTPMIVTEGTVTFENVNLTRTQPNYVAVQIDGGKFTVTVNEKDEHGAINGTLLYNDTSAEVVINGTKIGYTGKLAEGITCEQANIMVNGEKLKHGYSNEVVEWSWTGDDKTGYTAATATFTCTLCGQGKTQVTANEGGGLLKETDQATCTKNGKETYTATVTVPNTESEQATATKERTLTATGHEYTVVWNWQEGYTYSSETKPTLTVTLTCDHDCGETKVVTVSVGENLVVVEDDGRKDADCTNDGSVTFTATLTYDGLKAGQATTNKKEYTITQLGHDYTVKDDGTTKYHDNENGTHSVICNRCKVVYSEESTNHVYTNGISYTWLEDDGISHKAICDKCQNETTERCTPSSSLTSEKCPKCSHEYADTVNVYYHKATGTGAISPNSTLYLYVYILGSSKAEPYGVWADKKLEFETTASVGNWYKVSFTIARGHVGNDLKVIVNNQQDGNVNQTDGILVIANDIWVPKWAGGSTAYTTQQAAEAAENVKSPTNEYFIVGDFNGGELWKPSIYTWERVFSSENGYVIVGNFYKGNKFRIIQTGTNWRTNIGWSNFYSSSATTALNGVLEKYTEDNNIEVTVDCTLKITCSGTTKKIELISNGSFHTHVLDDSTHKDQEAATCSKAGMYAHYECTCGLLFNEDKKVTTKAALEIQIDPDAHHWVEQREQPATCTADGWHTYYMCDLCEKKFATTAEPSEDQIFDSADVVKQQEGIKISALGHEYKLDVDQPWKWNENVATLTLVCGRVDCSDPTHKLEITIDGDLISTKEINAATCTEAQKVHYVATVSKEKLVELIKAADDNGKLSAELEALFVGDKPITDENKELLVDGDPATGHSYVPVDGDVWTWSESKEEATLHLQCTVCSDDNQATATFTAKRGGEQAGASCSEPTTVDVTVTVTEDEVKAELVRTGYKVNTVTIPEEKRTVQTTLEGEIPGHTWQFTEGDHITWVYDNNNFDTNETITAKVSYKCSKCEATVTITINDITGEKFDHTVDKNETRVFTLDMKSDAIRDIAKVKDNVVLSDDAEITVKDTFDELTAVTHEEVKSGDIVHTYEGWISDGAEGHHQECTVCTYQTSTAQHGEALKWVTEVETEQHYQRCETCNYESEKANCSLTYNAEQQHYKDYCYVCGHDYREEVTIHFYDNSAWSNDPYVWATYLDSTVVRNAILFSGTVPTSACIMSSDGDNWYSIKVKFPREGERYIKFADVSSTTWKNQTLTRTFDDTKSEIWCSKYGNIFDSQGETATENGWTNPSKLKTVWYVVGSHQGWVDNTFDWNVTFDSTKNNNTVTIDLNANDTFIVKRNVAGNYDDQINFTSYNWSFIGKGSGVGDISKLFTGGGDYGNDFKVTKACRLTISFDSVRNGINIYVDSASGLTSITSTVGTNYYFAGQCTNWTTNKIKWTSRIGTDIYLFDNIKIKDNVGVNENLNWKLKGSDDSSWSDGNWGIGCVKALTYANQGVNSVTCSGSDNIVMNRGCTVRIVLDTSRGTVGIQVLSL